MSLIIESEKITEIAKKIAKEMGIESHEICNSKRCHEIYILAVREYDLNKTKK